MFLWLIRLFAVLKRAPQNRTLLRSLFANRILFKDVARVFDNVVNKVLYIDNQSEVAFDKIIRSYPNEMFLIFKIL